MTNYEYFLTIFLACWLLVKVVAVFSSRSKVLVVKDKELLALQLDNSEMVAECGELKFRVEGLETDIEAAVAKARVSDFEVELLKAKFLKGV